jgi:hypothetical protein
MAFCPSGIMTFGIL